MIDITNGAVEGLGMSKFDKKSKQENVGFRYVSRDGSGVCLSI